MCPQIYSPIPISIDQANLSNISSDNSYPIILFEIKRRNPQGVPKKGVFLLNAHFMGLHGLKLKSGRKQKFNFT